MADEKALLGDDELDAMIEKFNFDKAAPPEQEGLSGSPEDVAPPRGTGIGSGLFTGREPLGKNWDVEQNTLNEINKSFDGNESTTAMPTTAELLAESNEQETAPKPKEENTETDYEKLIREVRMPSNIQNEIDSLVKSAEASEKAQTSVFPVDAEVVITIRPSKLEALIIVNSPQNGGKDISLAELQQKIYETKISHGINETLISDIAEEKIYDAIFIFAMGEAPVNGMDGYIKPRFDQARRLKPKLLEDGTVDYRDLGTIVNIRKGDVIADIHEATLGKTGCDIFGNIIQAYNGKMPPLPIGSNVGVSGDKDKIIALQDGNLTFKQSKFEVETTVTIDGNVGVSTGNIRFLGDVLVKGNVEDGYIVESEKNITVNGMVNGALLIAENDIIVKNGVINSMFTSKNGSVSVGFAEGTHIRCHGKLTASSLVSCTVDSEGEVDVTKAPGAIVGGNCGSMNNVTCNTLGHRNYIATSVTLGAFDELLAEKGQIKLQLSEIDSTISKITMTLELLNQQKEKQGHLDKEKEDFISAAIRLRIQKTAEKRPLNVRLLEIETILDDSRKMIINVKRFLHPNVRIKIGSFFHQTSVEYGKCTVYTDREGIRIAVL